MNGLLAIRKPVSRQRCFRQSYFSVFSFFKLYFAFLFLPSRRIKFSWSPLFLAGHLNIADKTYMTHSTEATERRISAAHIYACTYLHRTVFESYTARLGQDEVGIFQTWLGSGRVSPVSFGLVLRSLCSFSTLYPPSIHTQHTLSAHFLFYNRSDIKQGEKEARVARLEERARLVEESRRSYEERVRREEDDIASREREVRLKRGGGGRALALLRRTYCRSNDSGGEDNELTPLAPFLYSCSFRKQKTR